MSTGTSRYVDRIVVGSDGSAGARHARTWAARRALAHGVGLTILRVSEKATSRYAFTGAALPYREQWLKEVRAAAQAGLEAEVKEVQAELPDLSVTGEFRETSNVALVLAQIAAEADLLVLGATGVSKVARAVLGGTVNQVIEHAHGCVAVVPESQGTPDGPVVVGLDRVHGEPVLERAATEARATSGKMIAVHGWEAPDTVLQYVDDWKVTDEHDTWLGGMLASLRDSGIEVETQVQRGRPADVLVDLSSQASVVVTGSRGSGGFTGLLLGSVSRSVIRRSACPVIVVRN